MQLETVSEEKDGGQHSGRGLGHILGSVSKTKVPVPTDAQGMEELWLPGNR